MSSATFIFNERDGNLLNKLYKYLNIDYSDNRYLIKRDNYPRGSEIKTDYVFLHLYKQSANLNNFKVFLQNLNEYIVLFVLVDNSDHNRFRDELTELTTTNSNLVVVYYNDLFLSKHSKAVIKEIMSGYAINDQILF